MRKFIVFTSLAVALGISAPSWGCTEIMPFPAWVDPATPDEDLPCIPKGMAGMPGTLWVLLPNGNIGGLDATGRIIRGNNILDNSGTFIPQETLTSYLVTQGRDMIVYRLSDLR